MKKKKLELLLLLLLLWILPAVVRTEHCLKKTKKKKMGGYSSKFIVSFGLYGFAGLQPLVIGLYYLVNTNLMQLHGTILAAESLDEVKYPCCLVLVIPTWCFFFFWQKEARILKRWGKERKR